MSGNDNALRILGRAETTSEGISVFSLDRATLDQKHMISAISDFMADDTEQELVIGGFAGTGKSSVISELRKVYRLMMVTPSNKAADVLRRKKVEDVMTLHRFFYKPPRQVRECARCGEEPDDPSSRRCDVCPRGRIHTQLYFEDVRGDADGSGYDAIVVDEASMVGEKEAHDIRATGVKLIVIGDPFQLPPPKSAPGFDLTDSHVMLKKVVRGLGEESGVVDLATRLRKGTTARKWKTWKEGGTVTRVDTWQQAVDRFDDDPMAQWITGTWRTCLEINQQMRAMLWEPGELWQGEGREGLPIVGDKVICRTGEDNGSMYLVEDVSIPSARSTQFRMDVRRINEVVWDKVELKWVYDLSLGKPDTVKAWKAGFLEPKPDDYFMPRNVKHFKYGYAITCHSSQGSEWPRVVVVPEDTVVNEETATEEENEEMRRRWLYTAVTRAKAQVILLKNTDHHELTPVSDV